MARVKSAMTTRARHKKVLKQAKGYYGAKHYRFRNANQAVLKSLAYAYVGRKDRKSDFRKLWITFKGIADINDVLKYKGDKVYINKDEFTFDGILDEDIIGMEVYNKDKSIGIVVDILKNKIHSILVIEKNGNKNMVPYVDEFIKNIDLENKKIEINVIEGLIDEN